MMRWSIALKRICYERTVESSVASWICRRWWRRSTTVGVAAAFHESHRRRGGIATTKCWVRCGMTSVTRSDRHQLRRKSMKCRQRSDKSNDLTIARSPRSRWIAFCIPPVRRQQTSSITMSLNLVSERLLSANRLNHQDLLPFLVN